MRKIARHFLIAISVSNLLLLRDWQLLLGNMAYFASPQRSRFLAVILCSILLAGLFVAGVYLARRLGKFGRFVAVWLFLEIVVVGSCALCVRFLPAEIIGALILFAAPLLLIFNFRIYRLVASAMLLLSPCVAFLFLRAGLEMRSTSSPHIVRGDSRSLDASGPRLLLVVFDELSEYVAFSHRPSSIRMPEFDRLRETTFSAENAYPPAGTTLISLPALLTGKHIREAQPRPGNLELHLVGATGTQKLSDTETIFSQVRGRGLNTALIGWYHPYCSILRDVDYCAHVEADVSDERYVHDNFLNDMLDVFAGLPLVRDTEWERRRSGREVTESHERENNVISRMAANALSHFHSGLMVVHFPVPHPPVVEGTGVYFANLGVADRELGRLRAVMENEGTWSDSTVIITSDHWWRTRHVWQNNFWYRLPSLTWTAEEQRYVNADEDKRVPVIVKMPGKNTVQTYAPEFNTLILSKLAVDCLAGEVNTQDQLKPWLDSHRLDAPVHAYSDTPED